jgi:hypothetical protein
MLVRAPMSESEDLQLVGQMVLKSGPRPPPPSQGSSVKEVSMPGFGRIPVPSDGLCVPRCVLLSRAKQMALCAARWRGGS